MRIPLATNLESRDGTVDQDAKVLNGIVETSASVKLHAARRTVKRAVKMKA